MGKRFSIPFLTPWFPHYFNLKALGRCFGPQIRFMAAAVVAPLAFAWDPGWLPPSLQLRRAGRNQRLDRPTRGGPAPRRFAPWPPALDPSKRNSLFFSLFVYLKSFILSGFCVRLLVYSLYTGKRGTKLNVYTARIYSRPSLLEGEHARYNVRLHSLRRCTHTPCAQRCCCSGSILDTEKSLYLRLTPCVKCKMGNRGLGGCS